MKAKRFYSAINDGITPILASALTAPRPHTARHLPLQYRSITSSRCLLAPAAQPQVKDPPTVQAQAGNAADQKTRPAPPRPRAGSAQAFGAPLNLRRPDQRSSIDQQQRDILASLTPSRNPQSSASLLGSRWSTPTKQAQDKVASQIGDILSRDDVHIRIPAPPPPRRSAYLGRAQSVDRRRGMEFGRALAALNRTMKVNDIRGQFHKQKSYERPGLKRKRLKRERWRTRFMGGFKAMVAKVKKMKTQGW